jgi:hypothetical protein
MIPVSLKNEDAELTINGPRIRLREQVKEDTV